VSWKSESRTRRDDRASCASFESIRLAAFDEVLLLMKPGIE